VMGRACGTVSWFGTAVMANAIVWETATTSLGVTGNRVKGAALRPD
jgi:hypothetical protein